MVFLQFVLHPSIEHNENNSVEDDRVVLIPLAGLVFLIDKPYYFFFLYNQNKSLIFKKDLMLKAISRRCFPVKETFIKWFPWGQGFL